VTGSSGSRVRGSLASLLEQSAAVVRGSANVAAVITARIDRLPPGQQLSLKVCTAAVNDSFANQHTFSSSILQTSAFLQKLTKDDHQCPRSKLLRGLRSVQSIF